MPSTTITMPAAELQLCQLFFYQNGLGAIWNTANDALMKKITATTSGGSPGTQRRTRSQTVGKRGRPTKAQGTKANRAKGAKRSGATIKTPLLLGLVAQRPVTREEVIAEFPGSDSNIIGRVIQGAMDTTKKGRPPLIEQRGDRYYLTATGQQLKAA